MRERAEACIEGKAIIALVAGRRWRLERPADLETLWEAMTDDSAAIPYWTELWPASLALAELIEERKSEIRGRFCCDIGCGLGLTVLLGQSLGALMLGVDNSSESLVWCLRNGRINGCKLPALACMDVASGAIAPGSVAVAWGGDIIYEKAIFKPFLNFLGEILAEDGKCWLAEPGRGIFLQFLNYARGSGWQTTLLREAMVKAIYPQEPPKRVGIWELRKG